MVENVVFNTTFRPLGLFLLGVEERVETHQTYRTMLLEKRHCLLSGKRRRTANCTCAIKSESFLG